MAKKEATQKAEAGFNDPEEKTYFATLKAGEETIARITIRAKTDEDAKNQLARSRPSYFEGIGAWTLTKTSTEEVEL